ncbi:hypothetical protein SAMN05421805_118107 [Saccharopolyspora antimicrobica]|uniref:Uncharacterized protein n=1 Tax=Saccharopolyspora antimicrobica TaxID=455193 RepID=A0A1I5IF41_9PSEU|nr:hypothetical protein [Saccharopolyspora antimicrobica]RKT85493.1 hypothetical protein ATL45_3840 [Saccharopolyspora antimicrobica]SFO59215.1 hypothetical protein SAMN05421805_118107 [Saccharopolyspora antimicrobica]
MALPPRLARKIQVSSVVTGSVSIALSLITGILIIVIAYQLPTATWATTGLVTAMGGLSAFFYFFSGITLTFAPVYVKNGHLNATFTARARRVLVVLWAGTTFTSIASVFFFTGTVSASVKKAGDPIYRQLIGDQPVGYTPPTIGYLILLLVPFLLSVSNVVIGWRLLRPAPGLLRKYCT